MDLKDETMLSVVKFSLNFDVNLFPTENVYEKENEYYYAQFKSEGKDFIKKPLRQVNFKVSLWFKNDADKDEIHCMMRFITDNEILKNMLFVKYDKNKKCWNELDLGNYNKELK